MTTKLSITQIRERIKNIEAELGYNILDDEILLSRESTLNFWKAEEQKILDRRARRKISKTQTTPSFETPIQEYIRTFSLEVIKKIQEKLPLFHVQLIFSPLARRSFYRRHLKQIDYGIPNLEYSYHHGFREYATVQHCIAGLPAKENNALQLIAIHELTHVVINQTPELKVMASKDRRTHHGFTFQNTYDLMLMKYFTGVDH